MARPALCHSFGKGLKEVWRRPETSVGEYELDQIRYEVCKVLLTMDIDVRRRARLRLVIFGRRRIGLTRHTTCRPVRGSGGLDSVDITETKRAGIQQFGSSRIAPGHPMARPLPNGSFGPDRVWGSSCGLSDVGDRDATGEKLRGMWEKRGEGWTRIQLLRFKRTAGISSMSDREEDPVASDREWLVRARLLDQLACRS
ncbi:hypothetical protein LY76DRAFT_52955 [Colletotrichum caudatum]|nr:hypothetical protein LY76DRAFT_52955 [Colletotrichum caudatum]